MADHSALLHAVGDIALGDHPLCVGRGAHSAFRTRPTDFPFAHVAPFLNEADIAFGNLECTLSHHGLRPRNYRSAQMRGQPSYVAALKGAAFSVLNVANNHSMQHGPEAFLETVELVRGAGIGVCGLAESSVRIVVPEVVVPNGLRIAFLGWSLRPAQYRGHPPLYAEGYPDDMIRSVRNARAENEIVVISLHWGDEFIARPSPSEVGLAHDLIDAGADLVIGHHPHVLRGCERYGRGWIIYSLGNFLGDMTWNDRLRESAIAVCRLTPEGVSDLELRPVRIADDYRPRLLDGPEARLVRERLAALSTELEGHPTGHVSAETHAEYRMAADRARAEERRRSRLHFLKRASQMPPGMLFQAVATFVTSRLVERE